MEERNVQAFGTLARSLVDKADACSITLSQSFCHAILYSKGYLYYLGSSAVKNTLYLPLQILLLFLLFRALLPVLYKMKWLPKQMGKAMEKTAAKSEKRPFDPER